MCRNSAHELVLSEDFPHITHIQHDDFLQKTVIINTISNGDLLRLARIRAELTQDDAARHLNAYAIGAGFDADYATRDIRRWEKIGTEDYKPQAHGRRPPSMAELHMLMQIYRCEPDELFPPTIFDAHSNQHGFHRRSMRRLVREFSAWPRTRQQLFLEWWREFITP